MSLNIAYQEINANGRNEDNPYYGLGKEYQYYTAFTDPQHSAAHVYDIDVDVDFGFATMTSATGATNIYTKSISDSSGYLRTNLASYYGGFPRLYAPIRRTQENDAYSEELQAGIEALGLYRLDCRCILSILPHLIQSAANGIGHQSIHQ